MAVLASKYTIFHTASTVTFIMCKISHVNYLFTFFIGISPRTTKKSRYYLKIYRDVKILEAAGVSSIGWAKVFKRVEIPEDSDFFLWGHLQIMVLS